MKINIILMLCFAYSTLSVAQKKETIGDRYRRKLDSRNLAEGFHYLESSIDTGKIKFVTTLKLKSRNYREGLFDLRIMFNKIKSKAMKLGANSFILNNYAYCDTSKFIVLALDAYYASDSLLINNKLQKLKNILYVFPDVSHYIPKKSYYFLFNGRQIRLSYLEYFKYHFVDYEKVSVAKGDASMYIHGNVNQHSIYLSYTGWTLMPYRTGDISYEDNDFGELLIHTLFKYPVSPN